MARIRLCPAVFVAFLSLAACGGGGHGTVSGTSSGGSSGGGTVAPCAPGANWLGDVCAFTSCAGRATGQPCALDAGLAGSCFSGACQAIALDSDSRNCGTYGLVCPGDGGCSNGFCNDTCTPDGPRRPPVTRSSKARGALRPAARPPPRVSPAIPPAALWVPAAAEAASRPTARIRATVVAVARSARGSAASGAVPRPSRATRPTTTGSALSATAGSACAVPAHASRKMTSIAAAAARPASLGKLANKDSVPIWEAAGLRVAGTADRVRMATPAATTISARVARSSPVARTATGSRVSHRGRPFPGPAAPASAATSSPTPRPAAAAAPPVARARPASRAPALPSRRASRRPSATSTVARAAPAVPAGASTSSTIPTTVAPAAGGVQAARTARSCL
jgi:hypothetical protein